MEVGSTIAGKYRVNRLLGAGGMASVWSATNIFTEREFAIKVMLSQVARTPEAARRFLLEAKVSARIDHPNIIDVIDVGQADDGSLFLVMELLTGMSLDVAVRRQQPPMTAYDLLSVMQDVAGALAAAHRSGVVHRDLKPTNIFLHKNRDGKVISKVLDFGVSKILEEENNTSLTIVGTVLGSPLYMSPEQAMGATGIDGRTDVFAFGSMLFEALTGRRAFDAPNFNALIVTIATKEPQSIDEVAPHLPESLRALVRECLVTDKEKRLASFDLVGERIAAIVPELQQSWLHLSLPRSERPSEPSPSDSSASRLRRSEPPPAKPASSPSQRAAALVSGQASPLAMQITNPPVGSEKPNQASFRLLRSMGAPEQGVSARALSAGVLVVAVIVSIAVAFARSGQSTPAPTQANGPAARSVPSASTAGGAPSAEPPPPASAHAVPLIAVDSLPVAARATAKGGGHLSLTATPGWCSISIDGVARGVTPLSAIELASGIHRVDCVPPNGRARAVNVTLTEGGVARHKFSLEE